MLDDEDGFEREFDSPPAKGGARPPRPATPAGWWLAALVIAAVAGGAMLLSDTRPSPAKLQAASDQRRAEAQIDDAAYGRQLAAAHAAKFTQSAQAVAPPAPGAPAEAASALSAEAGARDASATAPAP